MQANWSLVLNVLLLIVVIMAIRRMLQSRRREGSTLNYQPSLGKVADPFSQDDIIAVRKISAETESKLVSDPPPVMGRPVSSSKPKTHSTGAFKSDQPFSTNNDSGSSVMMFLLAKENRQLAGYELLQTLLAAGLRFGEGHLFHRHQYPNGQGPVLCSLAAATSSGVFDLQNIGAFSVHGLCLFMQTSGNPTIDGERFAIMLDTAKQLSEGLDTYLLDDERRPLTDDRIQRYYRLLNLKETCE